MQVSFYDTVEDARLKFAVILTESGGRWVFCKHRERETLECPGGHREQGETIEEAARRELYEETGAVDFTLTPVCVYSVTGRTRANLDGGETFGMLYHAEVRRFEDELHSEIERIVLSETLPKNWTYPEIQPKLFQAYARKMRRPMNESTAAL